MCDVGQGPDAANPTTCIDCAIASYSDTTDTSACTPCGAGETTVATGSTEVAACVVVGELQ